MKISAVAVLVAIAVAASIGGTGVVDAQECELSEATVIDDAGKVTLRHAVNLADGTFIAEVQVDQSAWLAFGTSPEGTMPGGEVVIIKPNEAESASNPGKYTLTAKSQDGVELSDAQTLIDSSFEQEAVGGGAETTTLRFTKLLEEAGETPIDPEGPNTFIFAYGTDDEFGYHST